MVSSAPLTISNMNTSCPNSFSTPNSLPSQVHEYKLGNTTIKSKMEIDPATQMDAGFYECQADNMYSIDAKGFRTDYLIDFD